ncbi:MAG: carbon-nitrogen hydrolase family protein [Patescibacteria group bacterium]
MKYTLALVQMRITWQDHEANLRAMEAAISESVSAGAQVVVFPEYAITGDLPQAAESAGLHKNIKTKLQALAKKYRVDLVPGSMAEKVGKDFFNTAYYIDHTGKILGKYKKNNLWHPERATLTAGDKVSVFKTRFGKAGLIICWDLIFPEIFRAMIKKGVEVVYCPSYWSVEDAGPGLTIDKRSEEKLVDAACSLRATENEIILAYCNPAKPKWPSHGATTLGHSQITAPFSGVLGKLNHDKEDILIREIDTDILKVAAKAYTIREDLRRA